MCWVIEKPMITVEDQNFFINIGTYSKNLSMVSYILVRFSQFNNHIYIFCLELVQIKYYINDENLSYWVMLMLKTQLKYVSCKKEIQLWIIVLLWKKNILDLQIVILNISSGFDKTRSYSKCRNSIKTRRGSSTQSFGSSTFTS